MARAVLYLLFYIFLALFPVTLAVVQLPTVGGNFLYEFGRNTALAAFCVLALQPVLTARFSWVDHPVGTLNCLRFHKAMGVLALALVLLHPMSLAAGGAGPKLLTSWDVPWFVVVGKVVLVILTIHVVVALLRSHLGLNFQTWKTIHAIVPPIILIGAFVHSWSAGADLHILEIQVCWITLLILAVAAFLYRRMTVGAASSTVKGREGKSDSL
jgi:predicted ferric reductase